MSVTVAGARDAGTTVANTTVARIIPWSHHRIAVNSSDHSVEQDLDSQFPAVYQALRRIARAHLRHERAGQTLQTTALMHEAYLRLATYDRLRWENETHFLAIAAQAMRRILVDLARSRSAVKRGGRQLRISLVDGLLVTTNGDNDLIDVENALIELETADPRRARIVELRFYGGMTVEQTAEALDLSTATVKREWRAAKAWLYQTINPVAQDGHRSI